MDLRARSDRLAAFGAETVIEVPLERVALVAPALYSRHQLVVLATLPVDRAGPP